MSLNIRNENNGTANAGSSLRAAEIEAINAGGGMGSNAIEEVTGLTVNVTNQDTGHINNAYGLKVGVNNTAPGTIAKAFAIQSNGIIELLSASAVPISNPPAGTVWIYTKSGDSNLYAKTSTGEVKLATLQSGQQVQTHNHQDSSNGGQLNASNVFNAGLVPVNRLPGMQGATGGAAGTAGLVPQPQAGDNTKFLGGDGTWKVITSNPGTVTSVGLAAPSDVFSITGTNPITSSGTLTLEKVSQAAKQFYASPNVGNGVPQFRSLLTSDLPNSTANRGRVLQYLNDQNGTFIAQGGMVKLGQVEVVSLTSQISIDIPSTYSDNLKHLMFVIVCRSTRLNQSFDGMKMTFNHHTTVGGYNWRTCRFDSTGTVTTAAAGDFAFSLSRMPAANSPSNYYAGFAITVYNWRTQSPSFFLPMSYTGFNPRDNTANDQEILLGGGSYWVQEIPTSVQFAPNNGDFFLKTAVTMYGLSI